jgi:hypothetical protein
MCPGVRRHDQYGLFHDLRTIHLNAFWGMLGAMPIFRPIGWLLGGPVGFGTLTFALLIGPAVQWGFRVCGVKGHRL